MTFGDDEEPFTDYYDLAEALTNQYNEYMVIIGMFDEFTSAEVMAYLKTIDSERVLNDMIDDDYGRGLLMGQIMAHSLMAQEQTRADAEDDSEEET